MSCKHGNWMRCEWCDWEFNLVEERTESERQLNAIIADLCAEVARYKEQAAKGTEYVLAQINEDLRAELTEMTKQRDHHASTIFVNSVQIGNLRAAVERKTRDRALAEKEVDELRAEVARRDQIIEELRNGIDRRKA